MPLKPNLNPTKKAKASGGSVSTGKSGSKPTIPSKTDKNDAPKTPGTMTSVAAYGKCTQSEMEKYFEFLKQNDPLPGDQIGEKALELLVRELAVEWMSFEMLVLMWKLRVSRAHALNRTEWSLAMYDHHITQPMQLRTKLVDWTKECRTDTNSFTEMYNFVYDFLRGDHSPWMPRDIAIQAWSALLSSLPVIPQFCLWVKSVYQKDISRDLWQQLSLLLIAHPDLADFNSDGKWPTAIDDFVGWHGRECK